LKVGISPSEVHPFKKPERNDENEEIVLHKTLHVPPAMTAQNLCNMISKKFNVSTPEVIACSFFTVTVLFNSIFSKNSCTFQVKKSSSWRTIR